MSQSISIILPKAFSIGTFAHGVGHPWDQHAKGEVSNERANWYDDGYVEFSLYNDPVAAAIEYLDWDNCSPALAEALESSQFWTIYFSNYEMARALTLLALDHIGEARSEAWIDNDYGRLIPAEIFHRMLKTRPDWDWRSDHAL